MPRLMETRAAIRWATSLRARELHLPNMAQLGLGNLKPLPHVGPVDRPTAAFGKCALASPGKDTTTGHWEMVGIHLAKPFPLFPHGFPPDVMQEFERRIGRGTLGNCAASGTEIIKQLGEEHMRTGKPIVYTSADSVFQVAAHEEVIPLWELYKICETAREMLRGPLEVGRVIARPFIGQPGAFTRTPNRKDYAVPPPRGMLLDQLQDHKVEVFSIGKIFDVFLGRGIGEYEKTKNNTDGMAKTLAALDELGGGLLFVNLVDFDQLYGHRNDVEGYARALEEFDAWLPSLYEKLSAQRSADHHGRPRLRPDHAFHRSQPRVRSAAGLPAAQAGRRRPGPAFHAFRHRPNRGRKLRRENRRRNQLPGSTYRAATVRERSS